MSRPVKAYGTASGSEALLLCAPCEGRIRRDGWWPAAYDGTPDGEPFAVDLGKAEGTCHLCADVQGAPG